MAGYKRSFLGGVQSTLSNLAGQVRVGRNELALLRRELDSLRCSLDVAPSLISEFEEYRTSKEYKAVYTENAPKVSVCVATYNRGQLLADRCLASIVGQDYENLEIIVVGDCCTDDTQDRVSAIGDERMKFVNLPERGRYPEDPTLRWMVAGTTPVNLALEMSCGSFITHLDDDDEFSPDRIRLLVEFIQETRADLVWHPFETQNKNRGWQSIDANDFAYSLVTTSSIFYHKWFSNIPWDINAYRYHEPGDWNRLRKIRYLGARLARNPEFLLRHYRERNQKPNDKNTVPKA